MKLSEGIITKSIKYQETSKIITILTNEGLSNYYVKGGAKYKSKNFSYSNELTKIGFDFSEKNQDSLKILTSGTIINNYSNLKQSFDKLNDCFLIMELINTLGKQISDYEILYNFLDDILTIIDERSYSAYYLIVFRLKLLYLLGVGPIFSRCVNCDEKDDLVGFAFEYGGMCCKRCASGMELLNNDLTNLIKFLYLVKLENLDHELVMKLESDTSLIGKFLDSYYEHFLGFRSKASKVIEKLRK